MPPYNGQVQSSLLILTTTNTQDLMGGVQLKCTGPEIELCKRKLLETTNVEEPLLRVFLENVNTIPVMDAS